MPRKPKKDKHTLKSVPPESPEIPKDLQVHINGIRAFAQTYNLLHKAHFPHDAAPAVDQSLAFIQSLHAHAVGEAQKHPAAHLVPELQAMKEHHAQS